MCTIAEALTECINFTDDIMDKVEGVLKKKKYKFTRINDNEILLNKKTKKQIFDLLEKNLDIPKMNIKLLLQVIENDNDTYIRLKFK